MAADDEPGTEVVDDALGAWRQGDVVLGKEHWFAHRVDPDLALTDAGREAARHGQSLAEVEVAGFAVVTQTCDVVRACRDRPFVEISPLVEVDREKLEQIRRGRRPAYAFLPALADQGLVVDLDRVMTVEKPVVASWMRTAGWSTDEEGRAFAQALARKRVRFAFPDDFTALARELQGRLIKKHGKDSDEGRGLRALREIRVCAAPRWDAQQVELFFWFVRHDDDMLEGVQWADQLESWLKLLPAKDRFSNVQGQVVTLKDLTAQDYVESDPLDLDHLTTSER